MKKIAILLLTTMVALATFASPENDAEIISTISFKEQIDQQSVLYTEKYLNGTIARQGVYFKNRKEGLWQKYDINGKLISEFTYIKDKRDGIGRVYENGKLKYEITYRNGERVDVYEYKL